MFKTVAKKIAQGLYTIEAMCRNGHTAYKKQGDTNPYSCPYCGENM